MRVSTQVAARLLLGWMGVGLSSLTLHNRHLAAQSLAASTPQELLKGRGLKQRQTVWEQPFEAEARRALAALPSMRQTILGLRRTLAQRQETHRTAYVNAQQRTAVLRSKLARADDSESRSQLKKLEELLKQKLHPDRIAVKPDVVTTVQRLIDLELRVLQTTLELQGRLPELERQYKELAGDKAVQGALSALGHVLSAPPSWAGKRGQVAQWLALVSDGRRPMYIRSGRVRIGALLDGHAPATFSWRPEAKRHWLTQSMAESIGAIVSDSRVDLEVSRGRTLRVGMTKCQMRIGRAVWKSVEFHVLPSEGEDVGAQLGGAGLGPWKLSAKPAELIVLVQRP